MVLCETDPVIGLQIQQRNWDAVKTVHYEEIRKGRRARQKKTQRNLDVHAPGYVTAAGYFFREKI